MSHVCRYSAITVYVESTPDPLAAVLNASVVLVAALIGLLGLLLVNRHERGQRRSELAIEAATKADDRSDAAFEKLVAALSVRALDLNEHITLPESQGYDDTGKLVRTVFRNRNTTTGGPIDIELQTTADLTVMAASPTDKRVAVGVATLLFHLKRGLVIWQVREIGTLVGNIRKWKTGDLSEGELLKYLESTKKAIEQGEEARARNQV